MIKLKKILFILLCNLIGVLILIELYNATVNNNNNENNYLSYINIWEKEEVQQQQNQKSSTGDDTTINKLSLDFIDKNDKELLNAYKGFLKNPIMAQLLNFATTLSSSLSSPGNSNDIKSLNQDALNRLREHTNININKKALYDYTNNESPYFMNPIDNLLIPNYTYPLKKEVYVDAEKYVAEDKMQKKNCLIMLLDGEHAKVNAFQTIKSFEENLNYKYHYPWVIISPFSVDVDENSWFDKEIVSLLSQHKTDVYSIKIDDFKTDAFVGGNWDYIAGGWVNHLYNDYSKFQNQLRNAHLTKYYSNFLKINKDNPKKISELASQINKIFLQFSGESIEKTNFLAYDLYNLDFFHIFDNFMTIKAGTLLTCKYDKADPFEGLDDDKILFKSTNVFKTTDPFLENIRETLSYLTEWTNNSLSKLFTTENFNQEEEQKTNLYNGIYINAETSVFISKFTLFRSMEYELVFKYLNFMKAYYNEAWSASEMISFFFSLFNKMDEQILEGFNTRKDFELLADMQLEFIKTPRNFRFTVAELKFCPLKMDESCLKNCFGDLRLLNYKIKEGEDDAGVDAPDTLEDEEGAQDAITKKYKHRLQFYYDRINISILLSQLMKQEGASKKETNELIHDYLERQLADEAFNI
ncbi:conserved putative glycolipid 2-alpha-mannosyltransferase [Saccharomycodes ludwigii]|uniref:conserved putative glycolipid 2-alpha-mannosyltransferase n=1 Tax=Saccharomycodes ludwigii TaxID=36035 RepID=UPI001E85DAAE|nr:conserved putative glycolipid 2-alpha-mannosyltransferase [Saccharomycodes ludwigii]KAH3901636.1 conserved putative glycolipid 2-alpha-mannosyltransferase [Saccharomycodes ludwigii]